MSLIAATINCIKGDLYAKSFALEEWVNIIYLLSDIFIFLGEPLVMKYALTGTWVLKPSACIAYAPVGLIQTLSCLATARAISFSEGLITPRPYFLSIIG